MSVSFRQLIDAVVVSDQQHSWAVTLWVVIIKPCLCTASNGKKILNEYKTSRLRILHAGFAEGWRQGCNIGLTAWRGFIGGCSFDNYSNEAEHSFRSMCEGRKVQMTCTCQSNTLLT